MTWTVVLAPVLALVGALLGSLVAPLLSARRTEALWRLQQRADLYAELVRFTYEVNGLTKHATGRHRLDLEELETALEGLKHLHSRLVVLASEPVLKTFTNLDAAYGALCAVTGGSGSPGREVADDDPLVVAVQDAVEPVRVACRRALVPR